MVETNSGQESQTGPGITAAHHVQQFRQLAIEHSYRRGYPLFREFAFGVPASHQLS